MSPNTSKNTQKHHHIHRISSKNTFSNDFIDGLMALIDHNPENLPKTHLFLPNRRACRQVQVAFLRYFKGKPVLLPKMRPIGEMDNDDLEFQMAMTANLHKSPELNRDELTIPAAMSPLHRTLLLAQLVGAMAKDLGTDSHIAMAQELGKLMDQIHLHGLDMADLPNLVDEQALAQHWQITLEFLKILSDFWPKILEEKQKIDAADRRNRMIGQLCHFYDQHRPDDIIIAIAPHSVAKNVMQLMDHIAGLPNGHVIIPGLDPDIDQISWDGLDPTHPQYVWKCLLNHLDMARHDIGHWGAAPISAQDNNTDETAIFTAKQWLLREIMRPAPTLEKWADLSDFTSLNHVNHSHITPNTLSAALKDWRLITCESPEQEAQIIAMALREQLEIDGRTAALITPDRHLARRVSAACRRWGITVDDSGGIPLHRERAGSWLLITAQACMDGLTPLSLLSMLKHPLANPGHHENDDAAQAAQAAQASSRPAPIALADYRRLVRQLERKYLRGPAPSGGFAGLVDHINQSGGADNLGALLTMITGHLSPFTGLIDQGKTPFITLLNAHIDMAEHMAGGAKHIWVGDDGEAAALFLAELNEAAHLIPPVTANEYIHIIRRLMEKMSVRSAFGAHPRLSILGRLESQLLDADFVIMAGLNEGSWPPEPAKDPWMSRPMRAAYGLPSPDEEIGRAAFDFTQLLLRPHVVMTRSLRVDGTPSVPARWLQRLDAVLNALNSGHSDHGNNTDRPAFALGISQYMPWLHAMDQAKSIQPAAQPMPRPPLAARPRNMGVTSIERWMADPYHIYAQKILRLKKLDPIEKDAQAAEFGEWVHHVLEKFARQHPGQLTQSRDEYLAILENIAGECLPRPADDPRIIGFWWPRFRKMMQWYLDHETQWRQTARPYIPYLESKGYIDLPAKGGTFTLTAKVDRIDKIISQQHNLDDHLVTHFAIIDYKTGSVPDKKSVLNGMRAQLPLEAIILEHNGFDHDQDGTAQRANTSLKTNLLAYWNFKDEAKSNQYTGIIKNTKGDDLSLDDLIQQSYDGVLSLINIFDDPATPYISLPRAHLAPPANFQDYAHLARVKEWNAMDGDQDG